MGGGRVILAKKRQKAIRTIQSLVPPLIKKVLAVSPYAVAVRMKYSGHNDDGCITDIYIQRETSSLSVYKLPSSLRTDIESEAFEIGARMLATYVVGWENNGGGHGEITIDLKTGGVMLERSWQEVRTTKETYVLPARKKAKK